MKELEGLINTLKIEEIKVLTTICRCVRRKKILTTQIKVNQEEALDDSHSNSLAHVPHGKTPEWWVLRRSQPP